MEFFHEQDHAAVDVEKLHQRLTIDRLTNLSPSISSINYHHGNEGEIYSIWGTFTVKRDEIRNGVRFAFVNCPHAFVWTVTFNEDSRQIIIHCTIDKRDEDAEFIESIRDFVNECGAGVRQLLQ